MRPERALIAGSNLDVWMFQHVLATLNEQECHKDMHSRCDASWA